MQFDDIDVPSSGEGETGDGAGVASGGGRGGVPEGGSAEWFGEDAVALMKANDELLQARSAIVDMLAEMEDIQLMQNPRIEAEWQVVVGAWENSLLEAQIAMRRAKRKCALVQARVNAGEPVDDERVELQLDWEFSEWTEQLEAATATYEAAVEARMDTVYIGDDASRDLKKLFRRLAKRLHPDLHPDLDERGKHLFTLAETAYRRGDVTVLRSLEVSTRDMEEGTGFPTTVIEAQAELAVAQAQATEVRKRLEELKQEKPYCLRALLDDEQWVEGHVAQIKREIDDCKYNEQRYLSRCAQMTGEGGAGQDD